MNLKTICAIQTVSYTSIEIHNDTLQVIYNDGKTLKPCNATSLGTFFELKVNIYV